MISRILFTLSLSVALVAAHPSFSLDDTAAELQALLDSSRYEEVMQRGAEIIADLRRDHPDGSLAEAEVIDLVVNACYRSNRVMEDEYLELGLWGVRLKEQAVPEPGRELATSLLHLGNLYVGRWENRQAIPHFNRALAILSAAGPECDVERAVVLGALGIAHRRLGEYEKAQQLLTEALQLQESNLGPDHPDLAVSLNNLAIIKVHFGSYSQARDYHLRALAIRENHFGPDSEWVGETLNNLAAVLSYMGDYKAALDAQERAVSIIKNQLGTDHQRYWWTSLNLGITYLDMGDFSGAQPICEEVLKALQHRYGPDHVETIYALDALASCRFNAGDHQGALDLYRRSLTISENSFGRGNVETADTIEQEGRCLVELGRLDEAAKSLRSSLDIRRATLDEDSPELCELLHYLSRLHLRMGDTGQALEYARRSRTTLQATLGESHPLLAEALVLEAQALYAVGGEEDVIRLATQAEDISRRHLQSTMSVLSEHRALEYAASRTLGLDLALSILPPRAEGEQVELVWDSVIRSRAVVLDGFTARNRQRSHLDGSTADSLVDSTLVLRERLANLVLRGPGWEDVATYRRMLDDTQADLNLIERRLSVASDYFMETERVRETGLALVRDALPEQTALVSFVRYRKMEPGDPSDMAGFAYKALVLGSPESEPQAVELGDAGEIDTLIEAWRDQVRYGNPQAGRGDDQARGFIRVSGNADRRLEDYLVAATALRERVWDPLSPWLQDSRQVFLVPDGNLNLVSFAALPFDGDHFLVERDPLLHILVTERSLTEWGVGTDSEGQAPIPGKGGLLVMGDPEFGPVLDEDVLPDGRGGTSPPPNPCLSLSDMQFGPLPWARREANDIKDIWLSDAGSGRGQVRIILGAEAAEAAFKAETGGQEVIHLATHGFFLPGACPQDENDEIREENPLALSGLVFAGGNQWWRSESGCDDGILTAQEVAALDLTGVRWVVLSACETGLGALTTQGEGVFGLRRSFALAGAQTVIMSLWTVGDNSTNEWMVRLYRARLQESSDTAHAVRAASLAVLTSRRESGQSVHPYYWAGFLAAGDWR